MFRCSRTHIGIPRGTTVQGRINLCSAQGLDVACYTWTKHRTGQLVWCAAGNRSSATGGRGRGRSSSSRGRGRGGASQNFTRPVPPSSSDRGRDRGVDGPSRASSSSLSPPQNPRPAAAASGVPSDDFVVIGKSDQPLQLSEEELAAREGASFWEAGLEDEGDEDEQYLDEEGEAGDGLDDLELEDLMEAADEGLLPVGSAELARTIRSGGAADAQQVEELMSLLQELAPELAEAGEPPEAAAWREVYTSRRLPEPQLGPVALKQVPGKGRGMVVTTDVPPGQLLLVAAPLGILYCGEGTTPENEELADLMANTMKFTEQQLAALQALRPAGQQQQVGALPNLGQMTGQEAGWSSGAAKVLDMAQQHLYDVVNANCTGEEFEDPVLSALRGTRSCGHVGLWPAVAMMNHSCCPNAVAYTIGDRMVVRASEEVRQGTEVTTSYLGALLTAPLAARQQELHTQYGFDCGCARCKAEARLPEQLRSTMDSIHTSCQQLAEQLEDAIADEDTPTLNSCYLKLLDMQADFEQQLRAAKPNVLLKRWAQASVYDMYDLLSLCLDQQPPEATGSKARKGGRSGKQEQQIETESLAVCSRLVGSVAAASSAHLDLVTEYMVRAEAKFGLEHQEAGDAGKSCSTATVARYGPVSQALLRLLMDTRVGLGTAEDEEEEDQ